MVGADTSVRGRAHVPAFTRKEGRGSEGRASSPGRWLLRIWSFWPIILEKRVGDDAASRWVLAAELCACHLQEELREEMPLSFLMGGAVLLQRTRPILEVLAHVSRRK